MRLRASCPIRRRSPTADTETSPRTPHFDAPLAGRRPEVLGDLREQLVQRDLLANERNRAALDLREVHQVVDQLAHPVRLAADETQQLRRLRLVGRALGQSLRGGRDRRDRRTELVRHVPDEGAPHGLGLFQPRHVSQDADGGGPMPAGQWRDRDLPDAVVGKPHGPLRGLPCPHGRLEAFVEGFLPQQLVDAAPGRRGHPRHDREAVVRLEDPQLRVDDDEPVGQRLEDHCGEPPLAFRPLERGVERVLHALDGRGEHLHFLAAGTRQVAGEVSRGDRRGAARQIGDRLRSSAAKPPSR